MGNNRDINQERARNSESETWAGGARQRDIPGLYPGRQRGFQGWQRRIETPSLNDMRAKQGAVVSKFMTFMNRKNTLMIELYERAFYNKKPGWDNLANFVYNDLCPTDQLRQDLEDVQFHPVKMIIFIKFKSEAIRDQVVARLQTMNGVMWTDYGVSVRGHSLDADVKLIRVLGVSPETTADDIRNTFVQVGVGEVIDLRRGFLDPRRLPGVTNGTWLARVKITDPNKNIPPYIIRREEGELWSLNFEGRRFVCWKCGSPDHIGDKCKDQERTFEEVFGEDTDGEDSPLSWAAVVKGDSALGEDLRARRDAIAKQIKEGNDVKAQEKKEAEDMRRAELEEVENKERLNNLARQAALKSAENQGKEAVAGSGNDKIVIADNLNVSDNTFDAVSDEDFLALQLPPLPPRGGSGRRVRNAPVGEVVTRSEGSTVLLQRGNFGIGVGDIGDTAGGREDDGGGGQPVAGEKEEDDGGGGSEPSRLQNLVVDSIDPLLRTNRLHSLLSATDFPFMGERSFTLDTSLERVFGGGATRLAIEFEGISDQEAQHNISDSSSSDSDPSFASSTPGREGSSKKRSRGGLDNFGDLSSITLQGGVFEGLSSGENSDEGDNGESKKPRLRVGLDSATDQESSVEEHNDEIENDGMDEVGSQQGNGSGTIQAPPGVDPEPSPRVAAEIGNVAGQQVHDESC